MNSAKKVLLVLTLNLTLAGCSLLPGRVEYGQREVKEVPNVAARPELQEAQKRAADFTADRIDEARVAAAKTDADASVQVPLAEASPVAMSLAYSLGAPERPWTRTGQDLADDLNRQQAKLDQSVNKYARKVQKDVGKDIEGTGIIQMGYFTQLFLVAGLGVVLWIGWKIFGAFYAPAALAQNVVGRVSTKVLGKGFHQAIEGGEKFKQAVKDLNRALEPKEIKELFAQAQSTVQDRDVQDLIKSLTK